MSNLIKQLIDGSNTLIKITDITNLNSHISDLIDPLSVIINLAILKYKPLGTKLQIYQNTIHLDEPHLFQSITRHFNGFKKQHLKILTEPILHACRFFIKKQNDINISIIFKCAIDGLNKLKHTYKNNIEAQNSITIFINTIDDTINNDYNVLNFIDQFMNLSNIRNTTLDNNVHEIINMKCKMYDQFNNSWSSNRIHLILNYFSELNGKNENDAHNILKSISFFLNDCNDNSALLLKHLSTNI